MKLNPPLLDREDWTDQRDSPGIDVVGLDDSVAYRGTLAEALPNRRTGQQSE